MKNISGLNNIERVAQLTLNPSETILAVLTDKIADDGTDFVYFFTISASEG